MTEKTLKENGYNLKNTRLQKNLTSKAQTQPVF